MGRSAVIACVVIAVAATGASAQPDEPAEAERVQAAVDALPVLGELGGQPTPVIVRGNLGKQRAAAMLALARRVHADVGRRFVAARADATPAVTLCLFDSDAEYRAMAAAFDGELPSELGFYRGDVRVAVINLARGVGNLRHELVHPLVGDDFPGIPSWLNEGLGSLYGTARATRTGMEPQVNYRLRDLHRAIAAGELPTLDELVASTDADVYSDRAPTFYAMGRYLLLYLHRRGRLDATYAALRDASGDPAEQGRILRREVDEDAFVAWASKLHYPSRR